MRAKLRAVAPDEVAEPKKPQTVAEAAESGSRLDLLVAMRTRIAKAVSDPECPPRDLAALTRRLGDVSKEIEALKAQQAEVSAEEDEAAGDDSWDASAI